MSGVERLAGTKLAAMKTDDDITWARRKLRKLLAKLYRLAGLGFLIPDDPK